MTLEELEQRDIQIMDCGDLFMILPCDVNDEEAWQIDKRTGKLEYISCVEFLFYEDIAKEITLDQLKEALHRASYV